MELRRNLVMLKRWTTGQREHARGIAKVQENWYSAGTETKNGGILRAAGAKKGLPTDRAFVVFLD
jgi:hypothetical protein